MNMIEKGISLKTQFWERLLPTRVLYSKREGRGIGIWIPAMRSGLRSDMSIDNARKGK